MLFIQVATSRRGKQTPAIILSWILHVSVRLTSASLWERGDSLQWDWVQHLRHKETPASPLAENPKIIFSLMLHWSKSTSGDWLRAALSEVLSALNSATKQWSSRHISELFHDIDLEKKQKQNKNTGVCQVIISENTGLLYTQQQDT